jgi:hypothetical protein
MVAGAPVSWAAKKKNEKALSSTEAEFVAMFHGTKEVCWLRGLLEEMGEVQQGPTALHCDSQGAIGLAQSMTHHGLNKHMQLRYSWLKDQVQEEQVVQLHYINTTQQPADVLTKRLAAEQHWGCMAKAGMASWSAEVKT